MKVVKNKRRKDATSNLPTPNQTYRNKIFEHLKMYISFARGTIDPLESLAINFFVVALLCQNHRLCSP